MFEEENFGWDPCLQYDDGKPPQNVIDTAYDCCCCIFSVPANWGCSPGGSARLFDWLVGVSEFYLSDIELLSPLKTHWTQKCSSSVPRQPSTTRAYGIPQRVGRCQDVVFGFRVFIDWHFEWNDVVCQSSRYTCLTHRIARCLSVHQLSNGTLCIVRAFAYTHSRACVCVLVCDMPMKSFFCGSRATLEPSWSAPLLLLCSCLCRLLFLPSPRVCHCRFPHHTSCLPTDQQSSVSLLPVRLQTPTFLRLSSNFNDRFISSLLIMRRLSVHYPVFTCQISLSVCHFTRSSDKFCSIFAQTPFEENVSRSRVPLHVCLYS